MLYHYSAALVRVIDADTVELSVDLGFRVSIRDTFRLKGINAPELNTEAGKTAKDYLKALIAGKTIEAETFKDKTDKYGRMLAVLWVVGNGTALNVNQALIAAGHAVRYEP